MLLGLRRRGPTSGPKFGRAAGVKPPPAPRFVIESVNGPGAQRRNMTAATTVDFGDVVVAQDPDRPIFSRYPLPPGTVTKLIRPTFGRYRTAPTNQPVRSNPWLLLVQAPPKVYAPPKQVDEPVPYVFQVQFPPAEEAVNVDAVPGTLDLVIAELAPALRSNVIPGSTQGSVQLHLNLSSPVLVATVAPGTLALSITTLAPVLRSSVIPATSALAITMLAPVLTLTARPGTLELSIATLAPALKSTVRPATLALSIATLAPVVFNVALVKPGTLALTITLSAPTLSAVVIYQLPVAPHAQHDVESSSIVAHRVGSGAVTAHDVEARAAFRHDVEFT